MEQQRNSVDITVAIPTFNRANELARELLTINSAVANAPKVRADILVCDNASSDHTQDVVESFATKNPQRIPVTYHRQEENIGADRNYIDAITKAQGRYVLTLGDDDLLNPSALKLLGILTKYNSPSLVHFNASRFDHITGNHIDKELVKNKPYKTYYDKNHFFFDPIEGYFPFMGTDATTISTLMWNRELATKYANDTDIQEHNGSLLVQCHLYAKMIAAYPHAEWVHQPLVDYGVNMGAQMSDPAKLIGNRFNEELLSHLLELGYSPEGVHFMREVQSDSANLFNVGQSIDRFRDTDGERKAWYQKLFNAS